MKTSVIIYEDSHQLRESIAHLLSYSSEFELLGDYENAANVEQEVNELNPDIILMDIDMPGSFNGIEAVKRIRKLKVSTHIIMLTVFEDNKNVLDAICAGADGYILKKHLSYRLVEAMHDVLSGGAPMSPSIARMVIASLHQKGPDRNNYDLTDREQEILKSLSNGNSYKMIAADFFISIDTVRTHIKNIYQKMQVHSQLEAVHKARNEGLV